MKPTIYGAFADPAVQAYLQRVPRQAVASRPLRVHSGKLAADKHVRRPMALESRILAVLRENKI